VLGLYLVGNPLLDIIELKTYDIRLTMRPPPPGEPAVAIVAIDEKSLAAHGRWPWSRATMARLVERLDALGARVIAFDVFFSEAENRTALEQIERLEREQGVGGAASPYARVKRALAADSSFGQAIAKSGKVVLPMVFLMSEEEARHLSKADAARGLAATQGQAIKLIRDRGDGRLDFPMPPIAGLLTNLPELSTAARASGHINSLPDARDGSVRWAPLVLRYQGLFFPSADVQAVRLYLDDPTFALHTTRYGISSLQFGERLVPTDEYGRALINYRGGPRSFPTWSAADVLAGRIDAALLRDKIVLIGATAQGLGDYRTTPVGAVFPGVEIRANTMQNLIDGDFIQRPGWMFVFDVALMLALGGLLVALLPRFGVSLSALVTLALAGAYLLLAIIEFRTQLIWINVVYPALLIALLYVSSTLVHYFTAEREKRQIKNAFQHYVPVAVVDQILHNIDNLGLGGDKRELTVLFSDIRGFTGIAEGLSPEALVQLLNDYLTQMTDKVFQHDGLLDKYIGDAIMAVYGAPIPHPQHARLACRTAVDMMQELRRLQAEWKQRGLPGMDIGIGINTGPMVVGNMGSKTRFDYTVIGDAVNLGARIEALNKQYGTHILISEFTYNQVKDEFPQAREIDVTTVRGRSEPVRLYELMLAEDYPHLDWLPEFARAYELFRADLRTQARTVFKMLAENYGDPVSHYYVERCQTARRRRAD
ncbi:MAG: adenylate/guanylate cyclase domain-containing protein, partial [Pseudomonadota bacterium]